MFDSTELSDYYVMCELANQGNYYEFLMEQLEYPEHKEENLPE